MSDNTTTIMFIVAFILIAAQSIAIIIFSNMIMSLHKRVDHLTDIAVLQAKYNVADKERTDILSERLDDLTETVYVYAEGEEK